MMNEHLFDDEKYKEIARLKLLIERYKEYDKKRKEYYSQKMQRLGELESLLEEKLDNASTPLEVQVLKLKQEVKKLNDIICVRGIENNRTQEELTEVIRADEYRRQNKELRKRINRLYEANDKLIAENIRLKQILSKNDE